MSTPEIGRCAVCGGAGYVGQDCHGRIGDPTDAGQAAADALAAVVTDIYADRAAARLTAAKSAGPSKDELRAYRETVHRAGVIHHRPGESCPFMGDSCPWAR